MTLFEIGMTRFSVHPAAVIMAALGALLGESEMILAYALALFIHEVGHYIASVACRCTPERMELTPFGALASIEVYHSLTPLKRFIVALCGPLVNLIFLLILVSLFYLNIATAFMLSLFKSNLLLIIFNLLPVLPMDGGRMFQSLLERCVDRQRSGRLLSRIGMACGAIIAIAAIVGLFLFKTLNLSMLITGIYLIYAAARAKQSAFTQYLHGIVLSRSTLERRGAMPAALIAVSSRLKVCELMEKLPLGQHVRIIVIDENTLKEIGEIKQERIEEAVLATPHAAIGELL